MLAEISRAVSSDNVTEKEQHINFLIRELHLVLLPSGNSFTWYDLLKKTVSKFAIVVKHSTKKIDPK